MADRCTVDDVDVQVRNAMQKPEADLVCLADGTSIGVVLP